MTRWGFEGSTFQGRLGHWHSPKARLAVRSREVAAVRPRHGSVGFGAPKLERDRVFWHRSLQDRRERGRFDNVDWHAAVPKAGGWTGKTSPPAKTSPSEHPNTRPILRITNGLEQGAHSQGPEMGSCGGNKYKRDEQCKTLGPTFHGWILPSTDCRGGGLVTAPWDRAVTAIAVARSVVIVFRSVGTGRKGWDFFPFLFSYVAPPTGNAVGADHKKTPPWRIRLPRTAARPISS